jgi:ElaB/YqjD/DUF883 family membrane-anchored ribosome-binding protein
MASATFQSPTRENQRGPEPLERLKEAGTEAVDKAKEVGTETFGKVKEAGAQVLGKTKEAVGSVGDMAAETASAIGRKADDLTAAAGHGIEEFGENVARKAPHEGMAGRASQAVADTIKGSGKYIEEAKLSGMAHDVEQAIKTHPIPAVLICFGIGVCIGRALKA